MNMSTSLVMALLPSLPVAGSEGAVGPASGSFQQAKVSHVGMKYSQTGSDIIPLDDDFFLSGMKTSLYPSSAPATMLVEDPVINDSGVGTKSTVMRALIVAGLLLFY